MADLFLYRADPVGQLAGSGDQAALGKQMYDLGMTAATPGNPLTPEEYKADPVAAITRLGSELAALKEVSDLPVKLHLPLTAGLHVDPMLVSGPLADLIEAGASILQFEGSSCVSAEVDASTDGFMLAGLPHPEGYRTAVELGALSNWNAERLAEVTEELAADRYIISIKAGDDLNLLKAFPEDCQIVLAAVRADGESRNDDLLALLDDVCEVVDQERASLTADGGFKEGQESLQAKVLSQVAEVSVMFWGFAV